MTLSELITDGYAPRKMVKTPESGETWTMVKDSEIYIVWNHNRNEYTQPLLVGSLNESN